MGTRVTTGGRRVAKPTPKEQRHGLQAMICGGGFVLLVGIKVLMPQTMALVEEKLEPALTHNMDLEAVFSWVGQGEEHLPGQLYQAVFGEEDMALEAEPMPQESVTIVEATGDIVEETAVYSPENLPENVSMEQMVLGFAYERPVPGVVTSAFDYRTEAEVTRFHYGLDLAGEEGEPISAFADGTVRAVGESSSYGKYVILDHANGFSTLYAHCSSICVTTDSTVTMGQEIGAVGETGLATGPHLHLELMCNNLYLNPIYYVEK